MTERMHADHFVRLVLGVLVAGFIYVCLGCGGCGLTKDERAAEEKRQAALTTEQRAAEERQAKGDDRIHNAKVFAKDHVQRFLKHPDDAGFGVWDDPEVKFNAEQDIFLLSSKVETKNELGKEATHRWEAIVMLNGRTWELPFCAIDGETVCTSCALLDKIIATEQTREEQAQRQAKREEAYRASLEAIRAKEKADEEARAAREHLLSKRNSNPLGLLGPGGEPVRAPLHVGDVTVSRADWVDRIRRKEGTYAHLWRYLEDNESKKWTGKDGLVAGSGVMWDNYVKKLIANGRILQIPADTSVRVVEIKPPSDRSYDLTDFKVEVLEGEHKGKFGWMSWYGLKHPDE